MRRLDCEFHLKTKESQIFHWFPLKKKMILMAKQNFFSIFHIKYHRLYEIVRIFCENGLCDYNKMCELEILNCRFLIRLNTNN